MIFHDSLRPVALFHIKNELKINYYNILSCNKSKIHYHDIVKYLNTFNLNFGFLGREKPVCISRVIFVGVKDNNLLNDFIVRT